LSHPNIHTVFGRREKAPLWGLRYPIPATLGVGIRRAGGNQLVGGLSLFWTYCRKGLVSSRVSIFVSDEMADVVDVVYVNT
jgi:hypothetical protein